MIKVKGASYRTVILEDIQDRVYFGQEKVFSDHQYSSSPLLKRSIEKGDLILLENKPDYDPHYKAPPITTPAKEEKNEEMGELVSSVMKLSDEVASIKSKIGGNSEPTPQVEDETQKGIYKFMEQMAIQIAGLQDKMDDRVNSEVRDQLNRVEEVVSKIRIDGPGIRYSEPKVIGSDSDEEPFIPSSGFKVDDMANNISLETKSIGQGSSINNSLAKLKALKQNNK